MALRIYNTLTKRKEEFVPLREGKVSMYVCGVTVYDRCHIGHARAAIVFDVIYRYLRSRGYEVTYVRNYTDIDDKIIHRANQEGVSWKVIAERYIREFEEDMEALGVLRPSFEPRATENIPQIITHIEKLIARGAAYRVNGDVYFGEKGMRTTTAGLRCCPRKGSPPKGCGTPWRATRRRRSRPRRRRRN